MILIRSVRAAAGSHRKRRSYSKGRNQRRAHLCDRVAALWAQRLNTAARYGQFTGGAAVRDSQINPVLADRSGYWLEAFANADRAQTTPLWRITALAQASPRSAPIVLQAWWQGANDAATGGRWLSWQEVLP